MSPDWSSFVQMLSRDVRVNEVVNVKNIFFSLEPATPSKFLHITIYSRQKAKHFSLQWKSLFFQKKIQNLEVFQLREAIKQTNLIFLS